MSTTAIIVNATDALGKSAQKSVTNVNPAATNSQLVALGQAINAISNNTYGGTVRIDKTDCDTETGKPEPTLTVGEFGDEGRAEVTFNGDADKIFAYTYTENGSAQSNVFDEGGNLVLTCNSNEEATITLYVPETANFAAKTVTVPFVYQ